MGDSINFPIRLTLRHIANTPFSVWRCFYIDKTYKYSGIRLDSSNIPRTFIGRYKIRIL